eukprot:TRINITY_DN2721_c0_g1_i2.p1 TRINITY_DN2721_c0_g1~~TRINITY_DN2721_c0_g1_i2.p1  ORF type:complete len:312 (+),score=74.81 TRINITY_DN2721_c0_g1_i2:48-938(+)
MRRGGRALLRCERRTRCAVVSVPRNFGINSGRWYAGGAGGPGEGKSESNFIGTNQPVEHQTDKQVLARDAKHDALEENVDMEPFYWDPSAPDGFGPAFEREGLFIRPQEFASTTGIERLEFIMKSPFNIAEAGISGPFGTPENPVLVPSFEDARIVGCEGGAPPRAHDLLWHEVRITKPTCCVACGQIFKLVPHPLKEVIRRILHDYDTGKSLHDLVAESDAGRLNLNIGDYYRAVRDNVILDHNGFPLDPENPAHRPELQPSGHGHGHGHEHSHDHSHDSHAQVKQHSSSGKAYH